jgi:hypothetical protein
LAVVDERELRRCLPAHSVAYLKFEAERQRALQVYT